MGWILVEKKEDKLAQPKKYNSKLNKTKLQSQNKKIQTGWNFTIFTQFELDYPIKLKRLTDKLTIKGN